jgi:hypothetical protein
MPSLVGALLAAIGTGGLVYAEPIRIGNPGFDDIYTDSSLGAKVSLSGSTKSMRNPYYVGFWTQTTTAWDWWCGVNPEYRVYMNTMGGRSEIEQALPNLLRPGSYALAAEVYRTAGPFAVSVSADLAVGSTVLTPETSSSEEPALGSNTVWTRTYSVAATNPLVGYPVKIRLGAGGPAMGEQRQVAFDDVTLAWLQPTIVAFAVTNGTATLQLNHLIPGATTVIQRADALLPSAWSNAQSFLTLQGATNWSESVDPTPPQLFYRSVSQH